MKHAHTTQHSYKRFSRGLIVAAAFAVTQAVFAAGTLDYGTEGYTPPGALAQNYTNLGTPDRDVNIAVTGATGTATFGPATIGPIQGSGDTTLAVQTNFANNAQNITFTWSYPIPVSDVTFVIHDIDTNGGGNGVGWQDETIITGVDFLGNTVFPTITPGAHYSINGANNNIVRGTANIAASQITPVAFTTAVTSVTVVYGSGPAAPADPGGQFILFGDQSWINESDLQVTKTDASPTYTPGTTTTYTIVVTNAGPEPVLDAVIADTLPAGATLTGPWTCVASAGSSCDATSGGTAGGSNINLTADLILNGTATITVPVQYSIDMGDY